MTSRDVQAPRAKAVAVFAAPFATAALLIAAFPPHAHAWLAWLALVPLALASTVRQLSPRRIAAAAALLFHLAAMDWLRTTYGATGLAGPTALRWLVQGLIFTPTFPLSVWLIARLYSKTHWPMALILPPVWIAVDRVRYLLGLAASASGFSWLQLGLTQSESLVLIQVADLGGLALVTALVAAVNGALCDLALLCASAAPARRSLLAAIASLVCLAASWGYGKWRLAQPVSPDGPVVCLMPAATAVSLQSIPTDTADGDAPPSPPEPAPDLFLWSEVAIDDALLIPQPVAATSLAGFARAQPGPVLSRQRAGESGSRANSWFDDSNSFPALPDCLAAHARQRDAALLVGCRRLDAARGAWHNALAYVTPERGVVDWYDKAALVPWTEFVPPWLRPFVEDRSAQYRPGSGCKTFHLAGKHLAEPSWFAAAICYDLCYPAIFRRYFNRQGESPPQFFAVAASEVADRTGALAQSLLAMARFRAIETRRSIVRNSEAGYSGLLDSAGRIVWVSPPHESLGPTVLPPVPLDRRSSLYSRLGDWPLIVSLAMLCMALLPLNKEKPRSLRPRLGVGSFGTNSSTS